MRKLNFLLCCWSLVIQINSMAQKDICSYCNGSSFIKCNVCNGVSHVDCIKCNGTGFIICPFKNAYSAFHPVVNKSTLSSKQAHSNHNNYTKLNSRYSELNNPNLVDNSEDIRKLEELIQELEAKKRNCRFCHGKGMVPGNLCIACSGTGTVKIGYRTPQFFTCNMCGGKGRSETFCKECKMKSIAISGYESCIKALKETHGMAKESKQLYYEQKNKMAQTNREFQENVNTMVDSYLNNPSYKSSVQRHSNGEPLCPDCKGSGKCHICKGDKVYENSYDNYRITNCSFCKQTGVCPMCHGRGNIR